MKYHHKEEHMKEVWIVKGATIENENIVEWQFSDGPAGKRGSSADYLSLEDGLREHSGCIIHWEGDDDQ